MQPRVIQLERASNLRDLGGWRVGGRRVRYGLVYRAPALVGLSAGDLDVVAGLGLRTVCDLRGVRERDHAPIDPVVPDNIALPIEPSVGASLKDILRTGQMSGEVDPAEMMALLREAYEAYALQSAERYRRLFALILEADRLPLLLHCSAGKDRTGFGSALILRALGVSWDDVVTDYLATNLVWRRETARMFDLPAPIAEVLLGAHVALLEAAFSAIDADAGSLDLYLEDRLGLDGPARARLAELLLEG